MRPSALRVRASMLLAATLLPLSSLADPLHLKLTQVSSEVDADGLSAPTVEARTRYGLDEALRQTGSAELVVDPEAEGAADLIITAKVTRAGKKYRLSYQLQTTEKPVRTKTLSYEFVNPSLSDKGSVAMAQALLAEAGKMEVVPRQEVPVATAEGGGTSTGNGRAVVAEAPEVSRVPEEPGSREYRSAEGPEFAAVDAPMTDGMSQDSMGRDSSDSVDRRPSRRRGRTNLDLGVALGFNSPSGIFGGELEYRVAPWLGLNVSGGTGAWGLRVGPLVRLYPFGEVSTSPFVEAGTSFNLGGEATTEINGGEVRYTDMLMTPVATAAIGLRQAMGPMYLGLRVGWGFRLREDNWTVRDGGQQDFLTRAALDLSQHGGFLTSITLGMSLF
ncbi:hypothetical protein [Corallococcus sicarius]|uniref:hypothetical protein n=1 Tax=Corallococcus sicarius TaxID=2316726 RepID=UPI0011C378DF|nr:hypothetical protein [Corallococcus sicarius]